MKWPSEKGVVVEVMRPAMGFGDAGVAEQEGGGLGLHGSAPVGVDGQLSGGHPIVEDSFLDERLEQGRALGVVDTPAHDASGEDVDDHVEVEIGPFGWPHHLRDVPRPDRVGPFGDQFRLLVDRMTQLITPFAHFAMLGQQAVHCADRAVIGALVQQGRVEIGGLRAAFGRAERIVTARGALAAPVCQ